jgi:hypothetical protein
MLKKEDGVMRGLVKGLPAWRLLCAAAFLCLASAVNAAEPDKDGTPPAEGGASDSKTDAGSSGTESKPNGSEATEPGAATEGDTDEQKGGDAGKPREGGGPSPGGKGSDQGAQAGQDADRSGAARLKDLIADGFLIRTTVFVPADAVTRQTGRISSDAMVLTLQKETAIAVCYYTLRAYVNGRKGLAKIPSCTVYQ